MDKKWLFRLKLDIFWLKMTIFDSKGVIWNDHFFPNMLIFKVLRVEIKWFLKFLENSSPLENEKKYFRVYFWVQIHYCCTALMWKIVKMQIADWLPYPRPLYINIGFWLRKVNSAYTAFLINFVSKHTVCSIYCALKMIARLYVCDHYGFFRNVGDFSALNLSSTSETYTSVTNTIHLQYRCKLFMIFH